MIHRRVLFAEAKWRTEPGTRTRCKTIRFVNRQTPNKKKRDSTGIRFFFLNERFDKKPANHDQLNDDFGEGSTQESH